MGDRAMFVCHENEEAYSPGIYIHWGGREAVDLLRRAAPRMNMYDAREASARLCAFLCEEIPGSKGVVLCPPPVQNSEGQIDWEEYGPGDAGVILIDVLDAKAECFAGYLTGEIVRNLPLNQSDL